MFRFSSFNLLKYNGRWSSSALAVRKSSSLWMSGGLNKFSISGGENQERLKSFSSSSDKEPSSKRKENDRWDRSKNIAGSKSAPSSSDKKPSSFREDRFERKPSFNRERGDDFRGRERFEKKPSSFNREERSMNDRKPFRREDSKFEPSFDRKPERRSSFRDSRRDDWGEEFSSRRGSRTFEDAKPSSRFEEKPAFGRRASFSGGESVKDSSKSRSRFDEDRFERRPFSDRKPSFITGSREDRFERKPSFNREERFREDRNEFRGRDRFDRSRTPSKPRFEDDSFKGGVRSGKNERFNSSRDFDAPKKRTFGEESRMESRSPRGSMTENKQPPSRSKDVTKELSSSKSKRRAVIEDDVDDWEDFQDLTPSKKTSSKKKAEKVEEPAKVPERNPREIERRAMMANTGKHAASAGVAHVLSQSRGGQSNTKATNQSLPNVTFISNPSQRNYDMDQAYDFYDNGLNENGDEYLDEFDNDDYYFGNMREWELENILSQLKK
ncbi:hypothetical protein C9374_000783 [Naegleria lovaniensis]|uniref:Uncharacterized protein n=1 Tax=Naegleria lovaniensis TaxID=51637 RepID=A0AA88GX13_NAELO|nr:uncharacterized protein C9374_000783 [Naegleria lovaniensis]KAG2387933.1 hypothetical protein C9374_000783 [Naegleria lovaniensis]